MRLVNLPIVLVTSVFALPVLSLLVIPELYLRPSSPLRSVAGQQRPIMSTHNIVLPPVQNGDSADPSASGDVVISDVIGNQRAIKIFAGFTRDISTISERLDDSGKNTTVLAPLNSELQKLPRKPWEDPKDYEAMGASAYSGSDGEDRAHKNLRRFVEAHVLPVSPWKEGQKIKSVGGDEVWWESKDDKKIVSNTMNSLYSYASLLML